MATSKAQRIGILIIMIVTVAGTIGSFAVMMLTQKNQTEEAARLNKARDAYDRDIKEYQEKVQAQGDTLSAVHYGTFIQYKDRVGEFSRDDVKEVTTEDLAPGEGETIGDDTKFAAYYIGWNPSGKIFDQSIDGGKLKPPLAVEPSLKEAGLIEGWKEGMKGMKIGGVREITIPSDKAYGEKGQGDDIPPNTPLKFVVLAIPLPDQIPQPEVPLELYQGLGAY